MTLYEIDNEIMNCIDDETGEIVDFEKLNELQITRADKLEGVGIAIKNLRAEASAIRNEEINLSKRRKVIENQIAGFEQWLANALDGQKFKTSKVACSFRKSTKVDVDENTFIAWAISQNREELLNFAEPKPAKTKIKEVLKQGEELPGANIVETLNLSVK